MCCNFGHDRRKILHTAVTEHPNAEWLSRQVTEAFPWDMAPRYLLRDSDASYGIEFCKRVAAIGHHGGDHCAAVTLAERLRRAGDRLTSSRMPGVNPSDWTAERWQIGPGRA